MFKRAVKEQSFLKMAIAGIAGSGKTFTSLTLATHLGNPIALVDTEHGSSKKYADLFEFDILELEAPYHPDRFVEAIGLAEREGYRVLILDSLSHAWSGQGGLLEIVDQIAKHMKTTNTFIAWKHATPIQNRLVDAILGSKLHVIATLRSKQDYVIEKYDDKMVPRKIGLAPIQREGFEYEFDVFAEMDIENNMLITKTRCPALTGQVIAKPGKELAETLLRWCEGEKVDAQSQAPNPESSGNGKTHWIDDSKHASFWSWARNRMGLSDDQVYEALGVEQIRNYSGTAKDAKEAILEYVSRQRELTQQEESPAQPEPETAPQ